MNDTLPLAEDNKLTVLFRVESGCLGPQGKDHVVMFCRVAQQEFQSLESGVIHWDIVPRSDKSLPEMQFSLAGKKISYAQAEQYLALFDKVLDEIEDDFDDKLAALIVKFLAAV
jgi:hypothetical protein